MDWIGIIGLAFGIVCCLIGATWKMSEIKDRLEDGTDEKIKALIEMIQQQNKTINQQDKAIALLQSQLEANTNAVNERVSNLHQRSKGKIQNLTCAVNDIQEWLNKASNTPGCSFIVRQREKETLSDKDDGGSWTNFG